MDINNINETLLKGLQQLQTEQAQMLSKVLGIKIGDTFFAKVEQSAKATPDERAQLAEQIAKTLSQLNPNSMAPATRSLINQLLAQQQMIQSGQLHLVNLSAQGADQQIQPLLTYTHLPLEQHQPLLLKLDAGQRLVILGALIREGITIAQQQPQNIQELTKYLRPLGLVNTSPLSSVISGLTEKTPLAVTKNPGAVAPQTLEALRSSITSLLPRKDSGQDLLLHLQSINRQVQTMPLQERNQWFTSELQQALKTLAQHVRSPQEMSHPKLLANALHNSGVYFEHKLAKFIYNPTTSVTNNSQAPSPMGGTIKPSTITQWITNKNPLLNTDKTLQSQKIFEPFIKQDLKGALLSVLHQVEQELEPLTPLPPGGKAGSTTSFLQLQPGQSHLAQLFAQIVGMPSTSSSKQELPIKTLRAQLMLLLHQLTLGSLAKIQLQQIHALNHQTEQADVSTPTQSWQFEIPLRHGQETHHLHLQMEYQWVDEKKQNEQESPNKVRQWQVMLGFNMETIGQFYVQLTLLGKNLSANFWAERNTTLEKARDKLDELQQQLEREGIVVKNMQCLTGLPPKPKMSLGYSLVDVQT